MVAAIPVLRDQGPDIFDYAGEIAADGGVSWSGDVDVFLSACCELVSFGDYARSTYQSVGSKATVFTLIRM